MDDLTKEQKHLLVSMYKEVLNRQPALSMEDANKFDDSDQLIELFSLMRHPTTSLTYVGNCIQRDISSVIPEMTLRMIFLYLTKRLSAWRTDSKTV